MDGDPFLVAARVFNEVRELSLRSVAASAMGSAVCGALLLAWVLGYYGLGPWWLSLAAVFVFDAYRLRLRQTFMRARACSGISATTHHPGPSAPPDPARQMEKEWQAYP